MDIFDGNMEMIPVSLLSREDEKNLEKIEVPEELSILPLKNNVLFPGVLIPLTIRRERSIKLVKDAYKQKKPIGVFSQKNQSVDEPQEKDIFRVGVMANIVRTLQFDDSVIVFVQGQRRISIDEYTGKDPYFSAKVSPYSDKEDAINEKDGNIADETAASEKKSEDDTVLMDSVKELLSKMFHLSIKENAHLEFAIKNIDGPSFLIYFAASMLEDVIDKKQKILEARSLQERAYIMMEAINVEIQSLELRRKIQSKVQGDIDKQHKEYVLNQQLKRIHEELGDTPGEQELDALKEKAKDKKWPEEIKNTFENELKKLRRTHTMSPDYSVQLNYLNMLADLPWGEYTLDESNIKKVRKSLDKDHFGLDKVKKRIIEHLSVLKLRGDMKAPILCLVGPPGVGKTSLGRSIAEAMGRKYVRVSLGGLRDEGEIRGHRKTYIGAMPGRIIQSLLKVKSSNPVFMLDEIDKVSGMTHQGDPSAALLEVLDPEQNTAFHDNFVDVDYDLSKLLFIATANSLQTIHPALLDRMEVIDISGYILEEKIQIAQRHLIPKQLKENGVKEKVVFSDKILEYIIDKYTRESGVRQLEKKLAGIIRYRGMEIVEDENEDNRGKFVITEAFITKSLGIPRFEHDEKMKEDTVGVSTGLAWTSVGGEILFIETALSPGKGNLTLTGNLGDVMKESATLAFEYIKTHAAKYKLEQKRLEKNNIHVHFPEGATPKDGPSAGIAIFSAMLSSLLDRKIRADLAMTGEITLRGKILPVGGIKEKILAAKRAGISTIVLCKENKPQIEEIDSLYKKGLTFIYVDKVDELPSKVFAGKF
ncbi:MAG: endopeptidase La [Bacteroidales bacterium]|jgi:ATP-dependent Lon protease|nr:endopeptidase La [Bacteroidales bacterium]